jgi:hypothetical protein
MIKIGKSTFSGKDVYELYVDGKPIEDARVTGYGEKSSGQIYMSIHVRHSESINLVAAHSLSEFPPLEYLHLDFHFEGADLYEFVWITQPHLKQHFELAFHAEPTLPYFNFTQVVFRLPDNLADGLYTIKVKAHGRESNSATIRIRS